MNNTNIQTEATEYLSDDDRIVVVASRIELLFRLCQTEIMPYIDLLEDAYNNASHRSNLALSAAPILGAMGADFDQVSFDWELKARRAKAVINLCKVLQQTEDERQKRIAKSNNPDFATIKKLFGI